MSKTIIIGEDQGLYLEVQGTDKKGNKYRKRTNREETIKISIKTYADKFLDGKLKGPDLVLYTVTGTSVIVRDYESMMNNPLLSTLFRRVSKAPIVSKNLANNERSNLFQLLGLRLLYMNKQKLAALALTGTILVSSVPAIANGVTNLHNQAEPAFAFEQIEKNESEASEPTLTEPEQVVVAPDILDFSTRLQETIDLKTDYNEYDNSRIMLGARVNTNTIEEIYGSEQGNIIIQTALTYGIDPYLLLAKGLGESGLQHEACCPGGSRYNGYGVGAFQLESPDGRTVKAWNFETESEDTLSVTMENATDFAKNAQAAAMYLQNRIDLYNGNVYLALQSYNYGQGMMRIVIHDYAKQMGITEEEVKNNYTDLGWLSIVEDIHQNPNNYYYRVTIDLDETNPQVIAEAKANYVWKHKTYGNPHYIADVLSYYVGLQSQNKNLDGSSTVINLFTNEVKLVLNEQTNEKVF